MHKSTNNHSWHHLAKLDTDFLFLYVTDLHRLPLGTADWWKTNLSIAIHSQRVKSEALSNDLPKISSYRKIYCRNDIYTKRQHVLSKVWFTRVNISLDYTASTIRFIWLKLLPWELDIDWTNITLRLHNTTEKQCMDGIWIQYSVPGKPI